MKSAHIPCLIAVILVLIVLGAVQYFFGGCRSTYDNLARYRDPVPFSHAEWMANSLPTGSAPIRFRMAQSLVESRCLLGLSLAEVEGMLGAPDYQYRTSEGEVRPAWYLMTWDVDRLYLVIRMGAKGSVMEAELLSG